MWRNLGNKQATLRVTVPSCGCEPQYLPQKPISAARAEAMPSEAGFGHAGWSRSVRFGAGAGTDHGRGASTHQHQPVAAGWDVSGEKLASKGSLFSPARNYRPIKSTLWDGMRGPEKPVRIKVGRSRVYFHLQPGDGLTPTCFLVAMFHVSLQKISGPLHCTEPPPTP